jgi:fatty acid desaturase
VTGRPSATAGRSRIPARLNLLLTVGIFICAMAALVTASRLPWPWQLLLGLPFSFLLLTNYALMHEAAHDLLHPDPRVNALAGVLASLLFPMAFTVFRITHVAHHCCNRTDHELFDYYYPHDRRFIKFIQWYGILTGAWYLLVPLGNLLLALVPELFRSRLFTDARTTAVMFDDVDAAAVRSIRLEVAACIALWAVLLLSGWVAWETLLLFYLLFGFNWSTRQFITHAFTPRDVRSGALNLRTDRWLQRILLNGNWDQVHHEHPHLSWCELPHAPDRRPPEIGYWEQYLSLWRGPRPCPGPAPQALPRVDYEALT